MYSYVLLVMYEAWEESGCEEEWKGLEVVVEIVEATKKRKWKTEAILSSQRFSDVASRPVRWKEGDDEMERASSNAEKEQDTRSAEVDLLLPRYSKKQNYHMRQGTQVVEAGFVNWNSGV
jgi:hypothetical protein